MANTNIDDVIYYLLIERYYVANITNSSKILIYNIVVGAVFIFISHDFHYC